MEATPDGHANPHMLEKVLIAERHYKHDALYFFRHRFADYWRQVVNGFSVGYFASALTFDYSINCDDRNKLAPVQEKIDSSVLLRDSAGRLLVLAVAPRRDQSSPRAPKRNRPGQRRADFSDIQLRCQQAQQLSLAEVLKGSRRVSHV